MRSGYGKCFSHPGKMVFKEKLSEVFLSLGLLRDKSTQTYVGLLVVLIILISSSFEDLYC